ncbi:MAG TPA: GNAT family N-acetyltransferase [Flavitalea sp.]|nr:GNAT family N-acetyltransferase [Flavitalea sp.]
MHSRLATADDIDDVFGLYMDPVSNPYLTYDVMTKKEFYPLYSQLIESATLFVVEEDEMVIATYRLIPKHFRQSHIFYLGSFVIRREMQGKGIGSMVLAQMIAYAKSENIVRLELTVDLHNKAAIRLYTKMGFDIEGIVKKNYRLASTGKYYDEYLMALILVPGS